MPRTQRRISFVLSAGISLALALAIGVMRKSRRPAPTPADAKPLRYSIRRVPPSTTVQVIQAEATVQFSFPDNHRISPGSLTEMTRKMHEAEIEIAVQLAREREVR